MIVWKLRGREIIGSDIYSKFEEAQYPQKYFCLEIINKIFSYVEKFPNYGSSIPMIVYKKL